MAAQDYQTKIRYMERDEPDQEREELRVLSKVG